MENKLKLCGTRRFLLSRRQGLFEFTLARALRSGSAQESAHSECLQTSENYSRLYINRLQTLEFSGHFYLGIGFAKLIDSYDQTSSNV